MTILVFAPYGSHNGCLLSPCTVESMPPNLVLPSSENTSDVNNAEAAHESVLVTSANTDDGALSRRSSFRESQQTMSHPASTTHTVHTADPPKSTKALNKTFSFKGAISALESSNNASSETCPTESGVQLQSTLIDSLASNQLKIKDKALAGYTADLVNKAATAASAPHLLQPVELTEEELAEARKLINLNHSPGKLRSPVKSSPLRLSTSPGLSGYERNSFIDSNSGEIIHPSHAAAGLSQQELVELGYLKHTGKVR